MAEGRARHDWDHTSFLAAAVQSCFSDRPVSVSDYNPFTSSGKRKATARDDSPRVKLASLKGVIVRSFIETERPVP